MFLVLGVVLLVAWLLGLAALNVTSWAIHLVLVLAVISFLVYLVSGTRRVAPRVGVLGRRSRTRFRRARLIETTRTATGGGTGN